jgi:hypothetical protein
MDSILAAEVEGRPRISTVINSDDETLGELGYRQEFKRKFNLRSIFSLSFSTLGLLPSIAATLGYSLG